MRTGFALTLLFAGLVTSAGAAVLGPLRIDGGLVAGAAGSTSGIAVYKGIPYAAPPVGALRWRAPAPVRAWTQIHAANAFGPACVQPPLAHDALLRAATFGPREPVTNEDCLYLNVWTSARSASQRLPVMVYFHGGGNFVGYAHQPAYDGENLARKGVVLVTLNYRLGVLGFFAHPELTKESGHNASGNYALMDMIAALQWVRRNIAAFGGDPGNVSIFGESAGASAINILMASPQATGLFHKAMAQSGAAFAGARPMPSLADGESAGLKLAETLRVSSLQELRQRSAAEVIKAAPGRSGAILDGWVLPTSVDAAFASGKQNDVPLLLGSNSDEGTIYGTSGDPATFAAEARRRYGARADAYLKLYPAKTETEVRLANNAVLRDSGFAWGVWHWAHAQKRTGKAPVYYYYFERAPPLPDNAFREWPVDARFGAFHSGNIVYVWNNLATLAWPWQSVDRRLADTMSSYWTNFARTGSPNARGLPEWPQFDVQRDRVMHLGEKIGAGPVAHRAGLEFFDATYQ